MKPTTVNQPQVITFLMKASQLYQGPCPELARYLMREAMAVKECDERAAQGKDGGVLPGPSVCQYCCQQLRPGSHRVRWLPKRRTAARVHSVLRREARGKRLSLAQRELLRRYRSSSATLMATCHTCHKTTRYNGVNREFLIAYSKTRATPQAQQAGYRSNTGTPKPFGKEKTPSKTPGKSPCNTPRKIPSHTPSQTPWSFSTPKNSPSSNNRPYKFKKWVVKGLTTILNRDNKPESKRGTLKDFLSSL